MRNKRDKLVSKILNCVEKAHSLAGSISATSTFDGFLLEELKKAGLAAEKRAELESSSCGGGAEPPTAVEAQASAPVRTVLSVAGEALVIARNTAELTEAHVRDAHATLRAARLGKVIVVCAGERLDAQKIVTPPFSAETIIAEIQDSFSEQARAVFKEIGIRCFDCAVGYEDDLREVARQHELTVEALVARLDCAFLAAQS